jgi:hypothetical protein
MMLVEMDRLIDYMLRWFETVSEEIRASLEPARN